MSDDDLNNLAEWVTRRRRELGLSQLDVAARGGPSNTTLTNIEAAKPPTPRPSTLRKLDQGLSWLPGSASMTLNGREPYPEEGFHPPGASQVSTDPAQADITPDDLVNLAAESEWADPDASVADLERAVALIIAAHAYLTAGEMSEAGQYITFAERLYLFAIRQIPGLGGDRPSEDPAYDDHYRAHRAQAEFVLLRNLISPPMVEEIVTHKPVFSYVSTVYQEPARGGKARASSRALSETLLASLAMAEEANDDPGSREAFLAELARVSTELQRMDLSPVERASAEAKMRAVLPPWAKDRYALTEPDGDQRGFDA